MKKVLTMLILCVLILTGCREASKVNYNLAREADAFNIVRQVTVINCFTQDVILQATGVLSIKKDVSENQLELIIKDGDVFKKEIIGLNDFVTYTVVDLDTTNVSDQKFTLYYNPNMWFPLEVK